MSNADLDKFNPAATGTLTELISLLLDDPAHAFSLGVQGALAEFMRSADEPCEKRAHAPWRRLVTRRGAIAIDCSKPLVVSVREFFSRGPGGWRQALDLCLATPLAVRAGRGVVTELGPDGGPDGGALICPEPDARLFDLGLGIAHVDVCISSSDADLLKLLRKYQGQPLFTPGSELPAAMVRASPRRVFISAASRIEVDTPIPLDRSPQGPHTHLLPERLGRPETSACCDGIDQVCVLNIHPAHPCRDLQGGAVDFNAHQHVQFQTLLRRFGARDYVEYKQQVVALLESGAGPERLPKAANRTQRTAARLALRQAIAADSLPRDLLAHWRSTLEPAGQQQG